LVAQFQGKLLNEAYTVLLFWGTRTVVLSRDIHGFLVTPNLATGLNLAGVWRAP
jgi:hypothetical protein